MVEQLVASHIVLVLPDSVAVLLRIFLGVSNHMKEGGIFASFQHTISVQVNEIENFRQGFIALLQIGDGLNQLHGLVLVS